MSMDKDLSTLMPNVIPTTSTPDSTPDHFTIQNSLLKTYQRLPVAFEYGEGAWLYTQDHKKYFDAVSGIAVTNLGHAHPKITQNIQTQAAKLIHTSNLYHIPSQEALAKELLNITGMDGCFFCNSGAEANEAAIKIARAYGHHKGITLPHIIVMEGAFHGRTLATLSATGNKKAQIGFEPLVEGFIRVPFNDIAAIEKLIHEDKNIVAILVEPIQGENGVRIGNAGYLTKLREICDQNKWLLMFDEVQSGNGRTGKYFAWQHEHAQPDVLTTAKGLGNGFPIGACIAKGIASQILSPGMHGTTFGGNPLASTVALTVINTLFDENLIENAHHNGVLLCKLLSDEFAGADYIVDIRGKGLMIGIELDRPCAELVAFALTKGLLINVTAEKVIRLLPPLIIKESEVTWLVETLVKLIKVYVGDDRKSPRA